MILINNMDFKFTWQATLEPYSGRFQPMKRMFYTPLE